MGFNKDSFINKSVRLAMPWFIAILFVPIQVAWLHHGVRVFVAPEEVHRRSIALALAIFVAFPILYVSAVVFVARLVLGEPKLQVTPDDGRVPEGATVAVSSNGQRPDDFSPTQFRTAVAITLHSGLLLTFINCCTGNLYDIRILFPMMASAVMVFVAACISVRVYSQPHRELSSESSPTEKTD